MPLRKSYKRIGRSVGCLRQIYVRRLWKQACNKRVEVKAQVAPLYTLVKRENHFQREDEHATIGELSHNLAELSNNLAELSGT